MKWRPGEADIAAVDGWQELSEQARWHYPRLVRYGGRHRVPLHVFTELEKFGLVSRRARPEDRHRNSQKNRNEVSVRPSRTSVYCELLI